MNTTSTLPAKDMLLSNSPQLLPLLDLYFNQVRNLNSKALTEQGNLFFSLVSQSSLSRRSSVRLQKVLPLLVNTALSTDYFIAPLHDAQCFILLPQAIFNQVSQFFVSILFRDEINKIIARPLVAELCLVLGEEGRHFSLKKAHLYQHLFDKTSIDPALYELNLLERITTVLQLITTSCVKALPLELQSVANNTLPVFENTPYSLFDPEKIWKVLYQLLIKEVDPKWKTYCL